MKKTLLCGLGLHARYKYLPKVSGDLGEISIACKRCGYGLRYFAGTWDIEPHSVQQSIREQAQIEYGHILGMLRGISDPLRQMEMAYNIIKDKFTEHELSPIIKELEEHRKFEKQMKELEVGEKQ